MYLKVSWQSISNWLLQFAWYVLKFLIEASVIFGPVIGKLLHVYLLSYLLGVTGDSSQIS